MTKNLSMSESHKLASWDYVTLCGTVLLTTSVGVYHAFKARKSTNTREFLSTNREIGIVPLILSSVATYLSAVGMIGFPMESYLYGMQCIVLCLAFFTMIPPVYYLFLPVFFKLEVQSIFEYLELRFNRFVRISASSLYMSQVILYTACVIYAPALALNQVTGLHFWGSVLSVGTVCILYSSLGGIKSVVWADATQVLLMFGVLTFLIIRGISNLGGLCQLWENIQLGSRGTLAHFTMHSQSPYTFWSFVIGGTTTNFIESVSNQMQVQRYLSSPSLKSTLRIFIGGALGTSFIIFLTLILGLVIYATYASCDPLLGGLVTSRDQIVPLFAVETLSFLDGLPGIFVAGLLCATLSTLSSSLNSLATITIRDYVRPWKPHLNETTILRISKIVAVVYGVVCILLVAVADQMGSLIQAVFIIFGAIGGPVFALFFLGMFCPWITSLGASIGLFAGLALGLWATIGTMVVKPFVPSSPLSTASCAHSFESELTVNNMLNHSVGVDFRDMHLERPESAFFLYNMSYLWYAGTTSFISVVFAILITMVTGTNDPNSVDEDLLCPAAIKLYRKLPFLGFKGKQSPGLKNCEEYKLQNGTDHLREQTYFLPNNTCLDTN